MTFKVLMTCAGGEMSPQVYSMLKNSFSHDIEILAVDVNPAALGRHFSDYFCVVPPPNSSDYVVVIEDLCAKFDIDMILPGSDEEVFALFPFRDRLEKQGRRYLACAPDNVLRKIKNKVSANKFLSELGLPVPEWKEASSLSELPAILQDMHELYGDLVVKPSESRGARDIYVIRGDIPDGQVQNVFRQCHLNYKTFVENMPNLPSTIFPVLVNQRLMEPAYDLDLLGWEGKVVSVVPRCRVNTYDPNRGYTLVNRPELIELGEKLIVELGISSLLDCDVMYGKDCKPYVIEINPRPSGSVAFSMTAGIPLLDDFIALVKGGPVTRRLLLREKTLMSYRRLKVLDEEGIAIGD